MQGTLDDFDLRYVFRFLSGARKTGKLSVAGPSASGRVFFRDGDVYHAESDLRREGFGRKLVKAGKITEQQLGATLDRSAATGRGLGEGLLDQGLIERADLEDVLCEEIQEVALSLFRNGSGRFSFALDEQVESDTLILLPVDSLIEEDSQAFGRRIPSLVMPAVGARAGISIAPEEWALIASIDGRRTVAEIAARVRMSEFSLLRSLQRLRSLGLVVLPGDQVMAETTPPPPPADRVPVAARRPPPPPPPMIDLTQKEPVWTRAERPVPTVDLTEVRETEARDLGRGPS